MLKAVSRRWSLYLEPCRKLSTTIDEKLRPETVLSDENRKKCMKKLNLLKPPTKMHEKAEKAAVLVPLCIHKGELGILYTLRSSKMTKNKNQVSFPGGKHDKNDSSLEMTALRETYEELGIPREKVDVWGTGHPVSRKDISVTPVLGFLGEIDPTKLNINHDEVAEAFVISLKNFCDQTNLRFTQFRNSYILPVYLVGEHRIWGLTAGITHISLNCLIPGVYKHKLVFLRSVT